MEIRRKAVLIQRVKNLFCDKNICKNGDLTPICKRDTYMQAEDVRYEALYVGAFFWFPKLSSGFSSYQEVR
jgi:hypothetical protein